MFYKLQADPANFIPPFLKFFFLIFFKYKRSLDDNEHKKIIKKKIMKGFDFLIIIYENLTFFFH